MLKTASVWRPTIGDLLVLVLVVGVGMVGLRRRPRSGEVVVVVAGSDTTEQVPLPEKGVRMLEVAGPLGTTVVEIDESGARIVRSPCREKLCQKMGPVRTPGDWVACIPNRVVIRLEAGDALDGVTR